MIHTYIDRSTVERFCKMVTSMVYKYRISAKNEVIWDVTPCGSCKNRRLGGKLFSNTFSLCSSLTIRDHVSHPYRTTGKMIVLYILIFTFFNSRREVERFWKDSFTN
jgi:hypothetical protein